jgi:hypothetical protein
MSTQCSIASVANNSKQCDASAWVRSPHWKDPIRAATNGSVNTAMTSQQCCKQDFASCKSMTQKQPGQSRVSGQRRS